MKIVMNEAPFLKSAIDSVVNLVEEGVFEVTEKGITLKAMDPSQISMISFSMEKSSFETFEISEPKKLGLDIAQFSNILSRGKKGEKVELSLDDGRLSVCFLGENKKRTFKINLLDIGSGVQKEPAIQFENNVTLNADAFKEILKDVKLISSHVKLMLNAEEFVVEVKGDTGHLKDEFAKGSQEVIELNCKNNTKSTFPLQYLEDMVKATSASTPLTIYLETDKPLKVFYELFGAKITYYLAPRIENE